MANEPDKLLPIANVGRIMKQILPPNAKISKEAKQTIQECATEFISFVTGEASDKCHKENRKTVNGDDICWALSTLGFDHYSDAIVRYLHKYREFEREKAKHIRPTGTQDKDEESDYNCCQAELQIETTTPSEFRFLEEGSSSKLSNPAQAYKPS
ncbi:Nuclear transcription factor Y subunit B-4 [Turnera subulata]|uniref:Nuclear transcription factor Y subunit B-4 n=1 Tax=Turnera subulata TaxID=218843 RepID=A0A9Q0G679_9ROSI|nr:Nuclear transcription factor Y subunit B-4 [Turnera subulata]